MPITRSARKKMSEHESDTDSETTMCEAKVPVEQSVDVQSLVQQMSDMMQKMQVLQSSIQQQQNVASVSAITVNEQINNSTVQERTRRLYDLPVFDGRPEDWPMFKEAFTATTEEYNYTNRQNLIRLQKALKGKAREAVECMLIHSENVQNIMKTLKDVFGRPETLIKSQLNKLRAIDPISENNMSNLLSFATKVNNLSCFLEAADCKQHLCNSLLLEELIMKLPVQRRIDWAKYAVGIPDPSVRHFSDWLQEFANVVSPVVITESNQKNDRRSRIYHANGKNYVKTCVMCAGEHDINKCKRFLNANVKEKWRVVRKGNLCFTCLKQGHKSEICSERDNSPGTSSDKKYNKLLKAPAQSSNENNEKSSQRVLTNMGPGENKLLFKVIPVFLYANGKQVKCYAFLDEGSSLTLINQNLAERLQLKGPIDKITLQWFGNQTITEPTMRTNLQISGVGKYKQKFDLCDVRSVKDLKLPVQTLKRNALPFNQRNIKRLAVSEYNNITPELLIGLDNVHLGIPKKVVADGRDGPAAVLTKLGWVVYGASRPHQNESVFFAYENVCPDEQNLDAIVKAYIENDALGVSTTVKEINSKDDEHARAILENSIIQRNEYFETGLLWKSNDPIMVNSRPMAEKRLLMLEKKLSKDINLKEKYNQIMIDYENKGYSRKLDKDEIKQSLPRIWYLPHFGVLNPNKPNKIRMVFDAAAEVEGRSLNSYLFRGPDLNIPLTTVLLKFRQKPFAICGDIKEMFHQIRTRHEDQAAQRYLWRDAPNKPIEEYCMAVMTFGATCSPCIAQYVKNFNALRYKDVYPEAVNAILNNHYVDDYVHCFDNEKEAIRVTKQVIWVHKQAGFSLRNFISNSDAINNEFGDTEVQNHIVDLNKGNEALLQKVLGMCWNTKNDTLKFALSFGKVNDDVRKGKRRPTKREVLKVVMSVFDPFGVAAQYNLIAKVLIQLIWRLGTPWDTCITDNAFDMWKSWLSTIEIVRNISIPRCYGTTFCNKNVELHIFCDASESAFAAVAYWRIPVDSKAASLAFIIGKTKCAPLKATTIPRLELQSAVIGSRLRKMILKSHDVTPKSVVMWSDSKTTLAWIKSDHRRYKPFVAHRVSEILENSDVNDWRWIPTALNPADDGTRIHLKRKNPIWTTGPEFLKGPEVYWPQTQTQESTQEELRPRFVLHVAVYETFFESYSTLERLTRIVAMMLRFVKNCKSSERDVGYLKIKELENAETTIWRSVQMKIYHEEYNCLINELSVSQRSKIFKLNPYIDENGVIRIQGRIDNALAVPMKTRRPIIMPQKNWVTSLVINYYHRLWGHQNESSTIAEIRRVFWIPHIREEVRRATKKCVVCIKNAAKPLQPLMGQLPQDRLTPYVRPFSYVGLDYMGPFTILIGRRSEKRWIALFTCLVTRAIHLEIAKDLSTDTCLTVIRNFTNRRGTPIRIRSDNGTNFVGADRELTRQFKAVENERIAETLAMRKIEWVFNCPLNPHEGGVWERLVRSVKRAMNHALYNQKLKEHTLYSLMCEAENIVNSRPLTHIPLDSPNEEPLTPNHFLLGTANSEQTPHPHEERMVVTKREWRKVQQIQHSFWKKWIDEYLPELCRRTKWWTSTRPITEGDLVLVCDDRFHRSNWPIGKIVKVFRAKDGQVRMAEVKTKEGIFKRSACMLARLDLSESK